MKRSARLLCVCAALAACPITVSAQPSGGMVEVTQTQAELADTLKALNALDEWLSDAEKKRNELQTGLRDQDLAIADLNQVIGKENANLNLINNELEEALAERETLQERQQIQLAAVEKHIRAAYRLSGDDFLKRLLNREKAEQLPELVRYHGYFSEARLEVVNQYQITVNQLELANARLLDSQQLKLNQVALLQREVDSLATVRAERKKSIEQLQRETADQRKQRTQLVASQQRLEALLRTLQARLGTLDGKDFIAARGSLSLPLRGSIRAAFGQTRSAGLMSWQGLQISGNVGDPITAIYRGKVVFADWLRGFGFITIIDHGDDYMSLYGHTDTLEKQPGDWVEGGEIIAAAGNSGGATSTGVYFELRHKGVPKDPITWVRR